MVLLREEDGMLQVVDHLRQSHAASRDLGVVGPNMGQPTNGRRCHPRAFSAATTSGNFSGMTRQRLLA
ncbi:hypothetical protein PF003_g38567 [Phytophthora fragariae]|nr:hypothetical protein PF003_g38567 [Phytophthora fragariae]